jgi:fructoselysine-6-P-deglycase FrlB-like protein
MNVHLSSSSHLERELATQPEDWREARKTARGAAGILPAPGERVAVVGCGTSLYMAQAFAALREDAGHGLTDAWSPTDFRHGRTYDRVLAITRSGTTTEIIDLLERLRGRVPAVVLTSSPGTPVLELAEAILTPEIDEEAVVQTRFATTTLATLRWHLGEDLDPVADQAEAVLAEDDEMFDAALGADQITFVGRGWTNGIAQEAALKLRESAQAWTESYSMMEYRHGPLSISAPGRLVWAFGTPVAGLVDDVARTGARLVSSSRDALADLVGVHRLCVLRARAAGLDPDRPRNLTRSIILTSA